MMRWAIVLVLTANIGTWLWFTQTVSKKSIPPKAVSEELNSAKGGVTLLSEETSDIVVSEVVKSTAYSQQGCWLYGPFTMDEASAVEPDITQLEDSAFLFQRKVTTTMDYWVYLPAIASERELTRILEELKAGGYDSFVYGEGELSGNIALSLEQELKAAKEQQQHFVDLGYDAEIYEMPGYIVEHWAALSQEIPEEELASLSKTVKRTLSSPQFSEKTCQEVASQGDFP